MRHIPVVISLQRSILKVPFGPRLIASSDMEILLRIDLIKILAIPDRTRGDENTHVRKNSGSGQNVIVGEVAVWEPA